MTFCWIGHYLYLYCRLHIDYLGVQVHCVFSIELYCVVVSCHFGQYYCRLLKTEELTNNGRQKSALTTDVYCNYE